MYIENKFDIGRGARVDKEAFGQLFQFYAPRIKALMMKQGSDAELAEDLMQDTMLSVWQKAEQFSNWRGSLNAWVYTIARNKRIDRFRKQGTQHYVDVSEYDLVDDNPDSERQVSSMQQDRIVSEATASLPAEQRQVVHLSYVEELSQSEIAQKLGIPLGTVKSRTRLAFRAIRKELEAVL